MKQIIGVNLDQVQGITVGAMDARLLLTEQFPKVSFT